MKITMWDTENKCFVGPDDFLGHYDDLCLNDLQKILNDKRYLIKITVNYKCPKDNLFNINHKTGRDILNDK